MRAARTVLLTGCGLASMLHCSSRSERSSDPEDVAVHAPVVCVGDAGQPCVCTTLADVQTCFESGSQVGGCACIPSAQPEPYATAPAPDATPDADTVPPFLGTWTLVGTERYVCAGAPSAPMVEGGTMTFRAGPGPTDAGEIDLLFDGGLGCALPLSVSDGIATLTAAPRTCGAQGKPIDRVFLSVQVTPSDQYGGWLQIQETFTDQSGCAYLLQGYLVP